MPQVCRAEKYLEQAIYSLLSVLIVYRLLIFNSLHFTPITNV
jgi:hypothetical protein